MVSSGDFIPMWNRSKGAKKLNKSDSDYVLLRWTPMPEGEVKAALDGYFSSDWGKKQTPHKFPIRGFLKDPASWIPREYRSPEDRASASESKPIPGPVAPPQPVLARSSAKSANEKFADEWNTAFPNDAALPCPISDELAAQFTEVVAKAKALRDADPGAGYIRLSWLIKPSKDSSRMNWEEVLNGKYDFKLKAKAKADAYDFNAMFERAMARRKAEQQKKAS
jgi:hypothetical protein